ncbi:hypothetical protein [Streptomyces ochraceiscleroticus]|uniref:Integral membrane protein n=1 Tax=Streptomyces ochraceiscleroticus TaxID=47761 RepID=A0ABW1MVW5_9ACTN|nr:hypothetical protein [Streptomyces ochraceiscleroticus]
MVRNVIGSLIALIGAAAAVWSPFRPWYDGRHGADIRIADLFNGITGSGADVMRSLLLPMLVAAVLTLIGVVLRSRLVITLAGLVVLGFTVLWMVRQGQAAGSLTVGSGGRGLGLGVAVALGGGVLLLLGALLMRGRRARRRRRAREREEEYAPAPYGAEPDDRYAYEGEPGGAPYAYEGQPDQPPYATHPDGPYGQPPGSPYGQQTVQWPGAGGSSAGDPAREPWPPTTHDGTTPPAGTPTAPPQGPYQNEGPYQEQGPYRSEPPTEDARPHPPAPADRTQPLPPVLGDRRPGGDRQPGRGRPPEER